MRVLSICLSIILVSCASAADDSGAIAKKTDVLGEWHIVQFDNFNPKRLDYDGGRNAYVNFYEKSTSFRLACNFSGNSAVVNEAGYLTTIPNAGGGMQTAMGCGKAREKRDEIFFKMMNSTPLVEKLSDGRVRLTTEHHKLILERDIISQRKNAIRDIRLIEGDWYVLGVNSRGRGWGPDYAKQKLQISKERINYGTCWPSINAPVFLETSQISGKLQNRKNIDAACMKQTDAEKVILEILSQAPFAEPLMDGDIQISYQGLRVVLTKDERWLGR